jgi:hypothetical protein
VGWNNCLNIDRDHMVFCDVDIRSWFNYGVLKSDGGGMTGGWFAWHGYTIKQPPGTKNSNPGHDKWLPFNGFYYPNHGPWRISRPLGPIGLYQGDVSSSNDWASEGAQPLFRWNSGGSAVNQHFSLCGIRGEGAILTLDPGSSGAEAQPNHVRVDQVYVLVPWSGQTLIGCPFAGQHISNVVVILGDMPFQSTGNRGYVSSGSALQSVANQAGPFTLSNFTIIDLRSTANVAGPGGPKTYNLVNTTDFPDMSAVTTIQNFAVYAPNVPGAPSPAAVDLTPGQWATTFTGWAWNQDPIATAYASTPTMAVVPYPPSAGGATRKTTYDMKGRVRPLTGDSPGALLPVGG